jgi:hypothetical protein
MSEALQKSFEETELGSCVVVMDTAVPGAITAGRGSNLARGDNTMLAMVVWKGHKKVNVMVQVGCCCCCDPSRPRCCERVRGCVQLRRLSRVYCQCRGVCSSWLTRLS